MERALWLIAAAPCSGGTPPGERETRLSIELSDAETAKLRAEATRLRVEPEELARAAVADLLSNEDKGFREAAEQIHRKNEELYRRLA